MVPDAAGHLPGVRSTTCSHAHGAGAAVRSDERSRRCGWATCGLDLSPIIVFIGLQSADRALIGSPEATGVATIEGMDVTAQVLHDVEFREAKRGGYNTQDVDEFLERLAVAVERQDAQMREARQRVASAEQRAVEAERRADEADRRPGGGSDADETLKRTLVLAQRTADAAIREAEEQRRAHHRRRGGRGGPDARRGARR